LTPESTTATTTLPAIADMTPAGSMFMSSPGVPLVVKGTDGLSGFLNAQSWPYACRWARGDVLNVVGLRVFDVRVVPVGGVPSPRLTGAELELHPPGCSRLARRCVQGRDVRRALLREVESLKLHEYLARTYCDAGRDGNIGNAKGAAETERNSTKTHR